VTLYRRCVIFHAHLHFLIKQLNILLNLRVVNGLQGFEAACDFAGSDQRFMW
jgi:hypothetical protein